MTIRECAIVTAYTGISMLQGEYIGELYKYAEEVTGIKPYTHDFGNESFWKLLRERSKPDFISLCENAMIEDELRKRGAI